MTVLGLNKGRGWFLTFSEAPLILILRFERLAPTHTIEVRVTSSLSRMLYAEDVGGPGQAPAIMYPDDKTVEVQKCCKVRRF